LEGTTEATTRLQNGSAEKEILTNQLVIDMLKQIDSKVMIQL